MASAVVGIGARLRAGREKLGLTVLQSSEKLHMDPKLLESLEAEDFAALGAPVYARGHLRNYAEFVGESATELSELYGQAARVKQPDLTRIAKAPPPSESNRLVAPALLVLTIFAVAGAVWWVLSLSGQHPSGSAQPHTIDQTPAPTSQTPAPGPPSGNSSTTGSTNGARAPATGAALPASSGTRLASAEPGARLAAVTTEQSAPDSAAGSAAVNASAHPTQGRVTLRFSADSWTEVYDASGARLFYDIGAADSVRTVSGTLPFRVVLGNAAGVSVEVNGRSTAVSKWAASDGSAQFSINRSGHPVRARSATDGG